MYFDIPYSHSVLFVFLFAIPFCIWHRVKEGKEPIVIVGIMLAFVSHPLTDIIFHVSLHVFIAQTRSGTTFVKQL